MAFPSGGGDIGGMRLSSDRLLFAQLAGCRRMRAHGLSPWVFFIVVLLLFRLLVEISDVDDRLAAHVRSALAKGDVLSGFRRNPLITTSPEAWGIGDGGACARDEIEANLGMRHQTGTADQRSESLW